MMPSLSRIQIVYSVFIALMILIITWQFFTTWQSVDQMIKTQHGGTELTYEYLLDATHYPTDQTTDGFQTTDLNKAPVYYGKVTNWYRLTIKNPANVDKSLILLLDNPMADRLEVFRLQKDGETLNKLASMGDTLKNLPTKLRTLPHINFQLAAKQSTTLVVHFETVGAPYLPLVVLTASDFAEYQHYLHLIWGSFIGIVLLMTAYNVVLYFGVGDRTYFLYISYITTMLLLLGVVHGYGYYLFPESLQQWLSKNIIAIDTLAAYFALQFCLYFLRFSQRDGRLFYATWGFSFLLLIYGGLCFFVPEYLSAKAFSVVQLITYGFTFRLIYVRVKTDFNWTKYYLFSWIPFFFGAAVGYLLFSGVLEYSFLNRHALMFSVIFEMAFISMALADRLGKTEQQRLFQATHDFRLGFANEALLEDAIKRYGTHTNRDGLALIVIEISNYDAVIPYLKEDQLENLVHALSDRFTEQIAYSLKLVEIDPWQKQHNKTALARGEFFSFLVRNSNPTLIENTLKNISNHDNFNPLQEQIPYRIHCLFGVTILTDYHANPLEMITQAKQAISQAAEQSKPYFIYDSSATSDSDRKIRLAQDLGQAIQHSDLELYHQPQILFKDPDARSSEVLLRWNHPQLGAISPVEFIEIAEETGLIKRLTRWVLRKAFQQTKELIDSGMSNLDISINISANDLSRSGFVDEISALLTQFDLPAKHFTLELTETAHLSDKHIFVKNFNRLKALGFGFAIDDFGTGYSSLAYANDHPFSELKIDRSFIQDMLGSNKQLTIVSATISMAKELGLRITAEGVEDEQTLRSLKMLDCDKVQGYVIARPMPFEQYRTWKYQLATAPLQIGENLTIPFAQRLDDKP